MIVPNWKPEPWAKHKARLKRVDLRARKKCCAVVWKRAMSRCECTGCPHCYPSDAAGKHRCGVFVHLAHELFTLVGHVDEILSKALGGDWTDPKNCRLLCHGCHFSGPSGAHRKTIR